MNRSGRKFSKNTAHKNCTMCGHPTKQQRTHCSKKCWFQSKDLSGKTFGSWEVIELSKFKGKYNEKYWDCKCKCGRIRHVLASSLKNGKSTKCQNCHNRKYFGELSKGFYERIRVGAKKRNFEFNISQEYLWNLFLQQNRKCALTDVILVFGDTQLEQDTGVSTASLDRINSKLGYIENNVQWVHKNINKMKMNLDEKQFIKYCILIAKKFGDNYAIN